MLSSESPTARLPHQMSSRKFLTIGVGGATNSGKTTISKMLCKVLPHSHLVCQDDYFVDPDDPCVERIHEFQNWDTLSALKMDKMVQDVKDWIGRQQDNIKPSVLIVEGFLLFNHSELADLLEKKFFITINKEICEERRQYRVYNPPDTPGYFDKVVWPSYLEYLDAIKNQEDIEYVDGMTDSEIIGQTILSKIESVLQKEQINGIRNHSFS